MAVPFLLDANISPSLESVLPDDRIKKTTDFGLSARADDMEVINLADMQDSILVSSDVGLIMKCRQFQRDNNRCLWGLLILPSGIEYQKRILKDLSKGRTVLQFKEIQHPLTWTQVREFNLLVRAELQGDPHVTPLCNCRAWED
jgi:hypothetical protein